MRQKNNKVGEAVAFNLRKYRSKKNISLAEVARQLDLPYRTYWAWENNQEEYSIRVIYLVKIARILKIPPTKLLEGVE